MGMGGTGSTQVGYFSRASPPDRHAVVLQCGQSAICIGTGDVDNSAVGAGDPELGTGRLIAARTS